MVINVRGDEKILIRIAREGNLISVLKGKSFQEAFFYLGSIRWQIMKKYGARKTYSAVLDFVKIAVRCGEKYALNFLGIVDKAYGEAYNKALDMIVYGCILPEEQHER